MLLVQRCSHRRAAPCWGSPQRARRPARHALPSLAVTIVSSSRKPNRPPLSPPPPGAPYAPAHSPYHSTLYLPLACPPCNYPHPHPPRTPLVCSRACCARCLAPERAPVPALGLPAWSAHLAWGVRCPLPVCSSGAPMPASGPLKIKPVFPPQPPPPPPCVASPRHVPPRTLSAKPPPVAGEQPRPVH